MKIEQFITFKELAHIVGCSYSQISRKHAKKIIELFEIDVSRLPKAGVLPVSCCEQYFNTTIKIKTKNTH